MKKICFALILFVPMINSIYGVQTSTRLWNRLNIDGVSKYNGNEYYIVSQFELRIRTNREPTFERNINRFGVGKKVLNNKIVIFGTDYTPVKSSTGVLDREGRFWQELSFILKKYPQSFIDSRTRFEQRWLNDEDKVALRFRTRLRMFKNISKNGKYRAVIEDEVFFNLNKTSWVSNSLFSQNRVSVGLDIALNNSTYFFVGYLNQYSKGVVNNSKNDVAVLNLRFNV